VTQPAPPPRGALRSPQREPYTLRAYTATQQDGDKTHATRAPLTPLRAHAATQQNGDRTTDNEAPQHNNPEDGKDSRDRARSNDLFTRACKRSLALAAIGRRGASADFKLDGAPRHRISVRASHSEPFLLLPSASSVPTRSQASSSLTARGRTTCADAAPATWMSCLRNAACRGLIQAAPDICRTTRLVRVTGLSASGN